MNAQGRLWVLRFSMGETFRLTDEWAERVGLPVRHHDVTAEETESREESSAR